MNFQLASQESITKQILINKFGLLPELGDLVKSFTFYDNDGQVRRNMKNQLIEHLHFLDCVFVEGDAIMTNGRDSIRYRYTQIKLIRFRFVTCYNCGNYMMSRTENRSPKVICNCGEIVRLISYTPKKRGSRKRRIQNRLSRYERLNRNRYDDY